MLTRVAAAAQVVGVHLLPEILGQHVRRRRRRRHLQHGEQARHGDPR